MTFLDLAKATVICGVVAYFIYSSPVFAQVVTMGVLSLLWLSYAHRAITGLRRR